MTLSHFSDDPIRALRFRSQELAFHKPEGLWVSVDGEDDWLSCSAKMEGFECKDKLHHVVTLAEGHSVLLIDTLEKLYAFDDKYGVERKPLGTFIDWGRVAQDHDGIIISPYRRGECPGDALFWYNGWDCASGCIWHPRAVARIEVVPLAQGSAAAIASNTPCFGMN